MTGTIKIHSDRDYYCSMKFKYLKIDLESNTTYNCHAAKPHTVDFNWLKNNPGNLFNTAINVNEREQMLRNERNNSCEQNCWAAEDNGAISPRLYQSGVDKTHLQPLSAPEIIDLTIGADCNLTCTYCCKEFSSAWRRDVVNNGNYVSDDNRHVADTKDQVLLKVSQAELKNTHKYQTLLDEITSSAPTLKKLIVTGGEPLLDNALIKVLTTLPLDKDAVIEIYTGLGVNINRFNRLVQELQSVPNVLLIISAETTGKNLEFNRYGIKWDEFVSKIDILRASSVNYKFHATLSNLTIFDFHNFYNHFKDDTIDLSFVYQPKMMSPFVLDDDSKKLIEQNVASLPLGYSTRILDSIRAEPAEMHRINIRAFLQEFVKRRSDLTLAVFPSTFLKWLELEHVV